MTMEDNDRQWARRVREIGADVVPPTPADPRAMADTAIRRARTRRALLTGGGGVAALALVAGATFAVNGFAPATASLPGSGGPETSSASGPAQADGRPAEARQDAPYWHARFEVVDPGRPGQEPVRTQDEIWYGNDRPGAVITIDGTDRLPAGFEVPWRMTWDELYELPATPDALRAEILRHMPEEPGADGAPGPHSEDEWIMVMTTHLLEIHSSPAFRDAAWQIVTGLDDVRVSDGADAMGRPGKIAQVLVDGKPSRTVVYDTSARTLLEWQINYAENKASTFTLVESGPVETLPAEVEEELGTDD